MNEVENNEIVGLVEKCYSEALDARIEQISIESPFPGRFGDIENPWPVYQEFYEGKHWRRMGVQPGWKSRPVDNKPFQICESLSTFITDNRARAVFLPTESEDKYLADKVQAGWNHWLDGQSFDALQAIAVLDSRKFGLGWMHLRYDKERKCQVLEVEHPENVLVDPDCTVDSFLAGEGPTYMILERIVQLGELKKVYGDKIDLDDFNLKWMPSSSSASLYDRIIKFFRFGKTGAENPALSVPMYILWIRDPEKVIFEEDLGDNVVVKEKRKYKGYRKIVVAGGVVLEDGSDIYNHGEVPLTPIFAYTESGKFYVMGDIQNILGPTVMLNRMAQLLYDSTTKAGGGILWVDKKQVRADMITNDPMQVIEVSHPDRAGRFDSFPAPSRHIFEFKNWLEKIADDSAGVHDISRGVYTPGNKTAQEIIALTESDKTRVRKATRMLAQANKRIARQWLSNAAQWKDWEWFLRIAAPDGAEMPVTFTGDDLYHMEGEGEEAKLTDDVIEFDIIVSDTSTIPTHFQEHKQTAMELFTMGVIDVEALLEALEFPGWRAILARMQTQAPPPEAAPMGEMPPGGMPMGEMPPGEMPVPDMGGGMPLDEDMIAQMEMLAAELGVSTEEVMAGVMSGEIPL